MSSSILRQASRWSFCILAAVVLAGPLTLGAARTTHAEEIKRQCTINEVGVRPKKSVYILCAATIGTFVIPTTDPSANRVLSVASMGALLEREVDIFHNNPADGTAGVCPFSPVNCFLIQSIDLKVRN